MPFVDAPQTLYALPDTDDAPTWRSSGATMARVEFDGVAFDIPLAYEAVGRANGDCTVTYRSGDAVEVVTLAGAASALRSALLRLLAS